jgi:hypothetical protein
MATTLFLRTSSSHQEGKACRAYVIHDGQGEARFTALAFRVPGRIMIFAPAAPDRAIIHAKPRRSFPLTGRYDVFDGSDEELLGVITRSGRFYDAGGRKLGRFCDARTWKEHVSEGVFTVMVEGIIAGDSSSTNARGADAYQIMIGDAGVGTLGRERVPFEVDAAREQPPRRLAQTVRRILPKRAGDALFERRPPHAWKLDVAAAAGVPDMLLLTAAILAIEIALW